MFTSKWLGRRGHDSRLLLGSTALQLPGIVTDKENGSQVSRLQKKKSHSVSGCPSYYRVGVTDDFLDMFFPVSKASETANAHVCHPSRELYF